MPARIFDALALGQFVGDAHRFGGIAAIVARDHLKLLAQHAAGRIDLFDRELPALFVGLEEGGRDLVGGKLADLDGVLRGSRRRHGGRLNESGSRRGKRDVPEMAVAKHATLPFLACCDLRAGTGRTMSASDSGKNC